MDSQQRALALEKIVSGGQTGVDRGALEAAMAWGLAHGGWCPRGRLAEDGTIPSRYQLDEVSSSDYRVRTEQNVVDSDATLILHHGRVQGGTLLTLELARKYARPRRVVDLSRPADAGAVARWIRQRDIRVLNVAGPRESNAPGISRQTQQFLLQVLADAAEIG